MVGLRLRFCGMVRRVGKEGGWDEGALWKGERKGGDIAVRWADVLDVLFCPAQLPAILLIVIVIPPCEFP